MYDYLHKLSLVSLMIVISVSAKAQVDTIVYGFGGYEGMTVSGSDSTQSAETTVKQDGYLPNFNAASRFLSQTTLGYNYDEVEYVSSIGIEDWIDEQLVRPIYYSHKDKVREYHYNYRDSLNNPTAGSTSRMWRYTWWNYHMLSDDYLRQRMALALSEIVVVSEVSAFGGTPYALGSYYDILLENAFGNYRDLLNDITYNGTMGRYLTFVNNAKTDTTINRFPDENYARELMQLFTIGLWELNMDGTQKVDSTGAPIPTYNNVTIGEFAKIFTGLTWADRTRFGRSNPSDTSYTLPLVMWNDHHEPGLKTLLNGQVVPDRQPVDGDADITDALDNVFAHPNTAPFVSKLLIQRMVTSNPSPKYVEDVAKVFADNGQGVRGDLKAVAKAIFLHPEAKRCASGDLATSGSLREPFIRYVQINKAFNVSTVSGVFRNDMRNVYSLTKQRPLAAPTVFNFFEQGFQPVGEIQDAGMVAPQFQLIDAQSITGYINGLYRWVFNEDVADEYQIFSGEVFEHYADEVSTFDFTSEVALTSNDQLHILVDRLNMLLAHGRLSTPTQNMIVQMVKELDDEDEADLRNRAKMAIYLVMSSPEYLIHR